MGVDERLDPMSFTEPVPTIPHLRHAHGPLLSRSVRRTAAVYWAVVLLGLAPSLLDWSPRWQALGLGLILPGGGFVYTSDLVFVALAVAVATYGIIVFYIGTNQSLLPVVWIGAAVTAPLRTHTGLWSWAGWVVPAIAATLMLALFVRKRAETRTSRQVGTERNRWLAETVFPLPTPTATPETGPELDTDELAILRWVIDHGLTAEKLEGHGLLMGGLRYQCNWLQWTLALAQYCRTPAFHGYLSGAQRRLIERNLDRAAWEFWHRENLLGNLDSNPDPIRRDNVMYSGYLSLMLETYASTTGDTRYDQPGSLEFRWNDSRAFHYDGDTVAGALDANLTCGWGDWGLYPCEPGLLFSSCNAIALNAMVLRDRRVGDHPTDDLIESYRRGIDAEFTSPDGRIVPNLSARYGFSNTMLKTIAADAGQAFFMRPLVPDIAARTWEILRHDQVRIVDGRVEFAGSGFSHRLDIVDPGSGAKLPILRDACVLMLAREMGDDELAAAIIDQTDAECDTSSGSGARFYTEASVFANAYWAFARMNRRNGWYDLVRSGAPEIWHEGPKLIDVSYPEVLVARAVSDGRALDLVLRPGGGGGRESLRIGGLEPAATYDTAGATESSVVADADGNADVVVDLDGRREVRITPA
jgi:linalool dehydratase/isomerase-like protein